jgi:hypothetical protein
VLKLVLAWEVGSDVGVAETEGRRLMEVDNVVGEVVEVGNCDEAVRIEEFGRRAVPAMLPGMGDIPALMDTLVVELSSTVEEELGARGVVFWLALGLANTLETKLAVE